MDAVDYAEQFILCLTESFKQRDEAMTDIANGYPVAATIGYSQAETEIMYAIGWLSRLTRTLS